MKTIVKLAVLFAALLVLNTMAFAGPPSCPICTNWHGCYSVDMTNLDNPSMSLTGVPTSICINGSTGYSCSYGVQTANLSVFTQGLNLQLLADPLDSETTAGHITFHGSWANHSFNGILFDGTYRWMMHGYYMPCD